MTTTQPSDQTARRMARLAGLSYVGYSVAGIYITFGPTPSISTLTAQASPNLELLFRTGLLAETVLYTFVVVSAAAMYAVLRSVSRGGALVAAFCRLIEGAMGATFIIFKYAAFSAALSPEISASYSGEARSALVMLFGDVYGSGIYLLLIPMSVGGVIFFTLFLRSRLIPQWLSAWGILTYAIIGCLAASIILVPSLADHVMFFFLPGALFEWVAALWLLFVGVERHRSKGQLPQQSLP